MVVNTANSLLVVSDIEGFVSVWDIKSYCMDKKNIINSKCMMKWRAHTQCITKMSLIETWNVVVTGSKDNSVRIWTLGGCYIGTLGQQDYWNIEDTSTYQHPIGPKDVLVDPALSVPDLKVGESSMESEMGEPENEMVLISDIETSEPDEEDKKIDEEILSTYGLSLSLPNSSSISEGGKRLRHFRTNSAKIKASVYTPPPGSYSSLLYQDLDDDNYHPINNIKTLKH
jgi:WD40 repeat protein